MKIVYMIRCRNERIIYKYNLIREIMVVYFMVKNNIINLVESGCNYCLFMFFKKKMYVNI